ncbi:phosphatase PAP2 family protein [Deinococcus sp. SDU3-2]|uniref:Phosphatase PAP2 family protein n=1 Tax=Deinococcus terrestris TaxID=2651870 RepID=A0A7X1NT54_9DEIO|nr:phosphatase PAP2 family protein [Deinococcus terrestris]MPY65180.1 phosphatase PAP2 family protein [Deinococcus terrestris]
MEAFWLAVTNLGRDEVFIVVLALYTWLVNPWGGRNLGVAFALSYLVNTALKFGFDLPRPFDNGAAASEAARATAGGPGLPSGHTQMAATLWGGIAAQMGRPGAWVVALVLIGLIAFSRLALNVHYPSDVIVGLGLGAAFAALAARGHFAQPGAARWLIPALFLGVTALLPAGTPREYAVALGLTAGFWFVRPTYQPPRDWAGRLIVALLGLLIVFAVYFGLAALLGGLSDLPLVRALRYAALVWVAAEGAPLLLGRWLRRA